MKEAKRRKAEIEYKQDNNTFVRPEHKDSFRPVV